MELYLIDKVKDKGGNELALLESVLEGNGDTPVVYVTNERKLTHTTKNQEIVHQKKQNFIYKVNEIQKLFTILNLQ